MTDSRRQATNNIKDSKIIKSYATRGISFVQLWRREWQVKQQGAVQGLYPLVLFLVIVTLFPLAVGSEPQLLQRLGVSAVWIAALLSLVMGVDGLFKPALDNGTLAQLVVAKAS